MSTLRDRITEDMKAALRAGDKPRLGAVRLILAAIKQREVDERIVLDDRQVMAVLEKMLKQRRDSITQYQAAARQDLADQEAFEVGVIQAYMPTALSATEVAALIDAAIAQTGATTAKDMGKVMALLKEQLQGRADMGQVGVQIKTKLAAV